MSTETRIPDGYYYSESHEWLKIVQDKIALVGVSDYAQKQLGDIVFIDFYAEKDQVMEKGDPICEIESVKAVESAYMPVTGKILEVNHSLDEDYSLLNSDPYEKGWLLKIEISNEEEIETLLNTEKYKKIIKDLEECE